MNFNKFLQSLFGNKSTRDMKLIQPLVEKVKAVYPEIEKLSNDELRAKTLEIKNYVQNSGEAQKEEIAKLKALPVYFKIQSCLKQALKKLLLTREKLFLIRSIS